MTGSNGFANNGKLDGWQAIQERLQDPQVVSGISRLLDHMDSINFAVEAFEGFISRGEVIVESVAGTVHDLKAAEAGGAIGSLVEQAPELIETGTRLARASQAINVDELEKSRLLERLTDPATLQTLNQLLDKLPLAAFLLESLDGFLQRGDSIVENVTAIVADLKRGKSDISIDQITTSLQSLPKLKELGDQLLESDLMGDKMNKIINAGVGMVDSGMLDKKVVSTLGDLGKKMVDTFEEVRAGNPQPIGGLWGMLKASRDPDVQKSFGFLVAFAKAFARHLR